MAPFVTLRREKRNNVLPNPIVVMYPFRASRSAGELPQHSASYPVWKKRIADCSVTPTYIVTSVTVPDTYERTQTWRSAGGGRSPRGATVRAPSVGGLGEGLRSFSWCLILSSPDPTQTFAIRRPVPSLRRVPCGHRIELRRMRSLILPVSPPPSPLHLIH